MYLFTRSGRFAPGSTRDVVSYVGEVTEKVRQETGLRVDAWSSMFSQDLGTVVWAVFAEDLGDLEQANDKLATSDSYIDLVDRGAKLFTGSASDSLAQVMAGAVDPAAPTPQYVSVARAVAANGQLGAALAGGVEISDTSTKITGVPGMFLVDVTGPYGGCAWTSGFADIGALQQADAALAADAGWLELIDRVGPAYQQGATQAIYRHAS